MNELSPNSKEANKKTTITYSNEEETYVNNGKIKSEDVLCVIFK